MSYVQAVLLPTMMLGAAAYGWHRPDPHAAIDPAGEPAAIRRQHLLAIGIVIMAIGMAAANLIKLVS